MSENLQAATRTVESTRACWPRAAEMAIAQRSAEKRHELCHQHGATLRRKGGCEAKCQTVRCKMGQAAPRLMRSWQLLMRSLHCHCPFNENNALLEAARSAVTEAETRSKLPRPQRRPRWRSRPVRRGRASDFCKARLSLGAWRRRRQ